MKLCEDMKQSRRNGRGKLTEERFKASRPQVLRARSLDTPMFESSILQDPINPKVQELKPSKFEELNSQDPKFRSVIPTIMDFAVNCNEHKL